MLNEKQEILGSISFTEVEKNLMLIIFRRRLKIMISVLFVMTFWILLANFGNEVTTDEVMELSVIQLMMIRTGFLFVLVYGIFSVYFFKRVYPFLKDYKNNQKDVINYSITMKRYFPYNNQFFIGLDHPDYLFHQIEEQEWKQLKVGSSYPLFRAHFSKYVFNSKGSYSIV